MARLIGGVSTSHVPSISDAIKNKQQGEPRWKPFFDAFRPLHGWLGETKPDVAVLFYNDHGLNFFLDKRPTFSVGAAHEYRPGDEGFGPPEPRVFAGDADLSWHIIETLVAREFDITSCQEMVLDHACTLAGDLLWPEGKWPRIVPVEINIVQHPIPSFQRCYNFGRAIGEAIRSYPEDLKVLAIGSGGLSHQINLAGHINEDFDRMCIEKIASDPQSLLKYETENWVDLAGSQGLEFVTWLAMRGMIDGDVSVVSQTYHQPLSNTGGAVMLLEAAD